MNQFGDDLVELVDLCVDLLLGNGLLGFAGLYDCALDVLGRGPVFCLRLRLLLRHCNDDLLSRDLGSWHVMDELFLWVRFSLPEASVQKLVIHFRPCTF